MKLYAHPFAPNPARVLLYLQEKSLDLDWELVDLQKGEHVDPAHLARNPAGTVPVLELDDGRFVTESLAIIEYLEELHPDPPLIGSTPEARALVRSIERDIEISVLMRLVRWVHAYKSPIGLPADPYLASYELERLPRGLSRVEVRLSQTEFAAGDLVTIADITLFASLRFASAFGFELDEAYPRCRDWLQSMKARYRG
ncbi:MAG: glutathione S-transferase family protein [Pseudomonadaceae bacterium]|nr:glutathione S-transferase family protein [Pseudomonadaceae bacterium]